MLSGIDGIGAMFQRTDEYVEEFLLQGERYTEGFLRRFTGCRKWLHEQWILGNCAEYHGARIALEKLLNEKKSE